MALGADRDTPRLGENHLYRYPVKGATKIYAGALVVLAAGLAKGGAAATGLIAVGRAEEQVDNSSGADSAASVTVRRGVFRFNNSASGDLIALSEVGKTCYVVDDQTVAKTDGSGARSAAGIVRDVDATGVWVEI
jgi:hypothetical protein